MQQILVRGKASTLLVLIYFVLTAFNLSLLEDWNNVQDVAAYTNVISKRKAAMSKPYMVPNPNNVEALVEYELWCEYYRDFISSDEECMEPMADWYYPILDTVDEIEIASDESYPDGLDVKAMLAIEFRWRSYITNILPKGSHGFILVFENKCVDDVFTYRIDGPKVTYLGVGDLHDTQYDGLSLCSKMSELNTFREGESGYSGLQLDTEECEFYFHAYPSDDMKVSKFQEIIRVVCNSSSSPTLLSVNISVPNKSQCNFRCFSHSLYYFSFLSIYSI
jgi:hypothetical protein